MGLRNYVGKLGGAVYYMNSGQNVGRELAPAVSNPRTRAQMVQRARLKNAVSFFQANAPWMKNAAFEGKPQNWSTYNAFVSANQEIAPAYLTKPQTAAGGGLVLNYQITRGSLPSVGLRYSEAEYISTIRIELSALESTATIGQFSRSLIASNPNLQEGDQISFILNLQRTNPNTGTPYIEARYYEFVINSTSAAPLYDLPFAGLIAANAEDGATIGDLVFNPSDVVNTAAAVIVSRGKTGAVKVSTQSLVSSPELDDFIAGYRTEQAYTEYAESYGDSRAEDWLAEGYQEDGTGAGGGATAAPRLLAFNGVHPNNNYRIGRYDQLNDSNLEWSRVFNTDQVDEVEVSLNYYDNAGAQSLSLTADNVASDSNTRFWQLRFAAIDQQTFDTGRNWQIDYVQVTMNDGTAYRIDFSFYGEADEGDVTD